MEFIHDHSDARHKAWCIHCGAGIGQKETNRDHVPSKSLLEKPYPAELSVVEVCVDCNSSFSRDEEYFAAFMGAVLSGTTQSERQTVRTARRVFTENASLRTTIEKSRKTFETIGGANKVVWEPEWKRVQNVVVKNARGHVYFELGQPAFGPPKHIATVPLELLSDVERENFLSVDHGSVWPEVGSRMLDRHSTGTDLEDGWVIVQDGTYRFAVSENDGFHVKIVIREYLAAEVIWDY